MREELNEQQEKRIEELIEEKNKLEKTIAEKDKEIRELKKKRQYWEDKCKKGEN